jgi:hypothetical protein
MKFSKEDEERSLKKEMTQEQERMTHHQNFNTRRMMKQTSKAKGFTMTIGL